MKVSFSLLLLFFTTFSNGQTLTQDQKDSINTEYLITHEKSNKESINKPFVNFSYIDNGQVVSNNSWKGKTVFMNFWFEACPPCIAEMDALNELYLKLKDNINFEFISFTFESQERLPQLISKYKIQYKVISISREECIRLNNKNGFPTSIILNGDGLIKYRVTGGSINKTKATNFIMSTIYSEIRKLL